MIGWCPEIQAGRASEEEVPLVGFALRPTVSSEAHFFSIIGAELVAEELPVRGAPWLQLSVHHRQTLAAEGAERRRVDIFSAFAHLLSLRLPLGFHRYRL